jgi:hypothetical protein
VSLEAASWCAGHGVTVVAANRDESGFGVRMMAGANQAANPVLSRALVLAGSGGPNEPVGVEIFRRILNVKLQGQAFITRHALDDPEIAGLIDVALVDLDRAGSYEDLRLAEALAAERYWAAWSGRVRPVWKSGGGTVPLAWGQPFPARRSTLGTRNAHATDPVNALLNYAYSVAEAACVLACWQNGLDPALGLGHSVRDGRYSLADDLLETVRPEVDGHVLGLTKALRAEHFAEVKTGQWSGSCRLVAPLTHQLAEWVMGSVSATVIEHAKRIAATLAVCKDPELATRVPELVKASAALQVKTPRAPRAPRMGALGHHDGLVPEVSRALVPDDLWRDVAPLIPSIPYTGGAAAAHPRRVLAGFVWVRVLGRPWSEMAAGAGVAHYTVQRYRRLWDANGVWERVGPVISAYYAARTPELASSERG